MPNDTFARQGAKQSQGSKGWFSTETFAAVRPERLDLIGFPFPELVDS